MRSTWLRRGLVAALSLAALVCSSYSSLAAPGQLLAKTNITRHDIRTAFPVNPRATYPYGADNAEQVWTVNGPATVKFATITATTSGSPNAVISATTGKKVRVLGLMLTSSVAGTVQFADTAGTPNNLTGVFTLAANGQLYVPPSKFGAFEAGSGYGVTVTVTGTSNVVGGYVVYINY